MLFNFSDFRYKEVVNIQTGFRLGYVCDAVADNGDGRIRSLIIPGPARLLGLLGREDDYVIPWESIIRVGEDIILVDVQGECTRAKRRGVQLW